MKLRKSRPLPSPTLRERPPSTVVVDKGSSARGTSVNARSWSSASSLSMKSMTLQYAEQPAAYQLSNRKAVEHNSGLTRQLTPLSTEDQWSQGTRIAPSTRSEMYWAGRALVAEMQVSERNRAQVSINTCVCVYLLVNVIQSQLEHAQRNHEERVSRLERFVVSIFDTHQLLRVDVSL